MKMGARRDLIAQDTKRGVEAEERWISVIRHTYLEMNFIHLILARRAV
jgi:hypothetical protein